MAVLLLLPVSVIFFGFLTNRNAEERPRSKVFMVISTVLIIAVMGFRNLSAGADTVGYSRLY